MEVLITYGETHPSDPEQVSGPVVHALVVQCSPHLTHCPKVAASAETENPVAQVKQV